MPRLPAIHVIDDEREMRYSIKMRLRNPSTISPNIYMKSIPQSLKSLFHGYIFFQAGGQHILGTFRTKSDELEPVTDYLVIRRFH